MNLDFVVLAVNSLRRRRLRSWLTMIGIFIGIAAVVSLISLGEGLENAITGQFSSLGSDKIIIQSASTFFGPPGSGAVRDMTKDDLDLVRTANGIDLCLGRLLKQVRVEFNDITVSQFAASMPKNAEEINLVEEANNMEVSIGRLLDETSQGEVVLGSDFLEKDAFDKSVELRSRIKINGKEFRVVGFLEKTGSIQGNSVVIMSEEDMRDVVDEKDTFDAIVCQINKDAEDVSEELEGIIRRDRNQKPGEEDFTIQTPLQVAEAVGDVLGIATGIVVGIAAISLIVGGIGIMNTMYTSIVERKKEIGIMKAIGATDRDILQIFLIEAGLLGLVGGLIGVSIGVGLAFGVSSLSTNFFGRELIQVTFSTPLVLGALLFSLLSGIFSGYLPAKEAAKSIPVENLRE